MPSEDTIARTKEMLERTAANRRKIERVSIRTQHYLQQLDDSGLNEMMARWGESAARNIVYRDGDGIAAAVIEAQGLLTALAGEAAYRIKRAMRAAWPNGQLDAENRELVLDDVSGAFRKFLHAAIESTVPFSQVVAEEAERAKAEADADGGGAFEAVIRRAAEAARNRAPGPDALRAAGVMPTAEAEWPPSTPEGVHPSAEHTAPTETPDRIEPARSGVRVHRFEPARSGVRVHRHDESGIGGPVVTRIETAGEIH